MNEEKISEIDRYGEEQIEDIAPPIIKKEEAEVGIIRELSPLKVLNQLNLPAKL